jgi:hypothetical protein
MNLIFSWLVESPRYLISKGKYKKAYKMLYKKKPTPEVLAELEEEKEIIKIYGPKSLRMKALICHFTWCVTSLTYYMLSLNAENFKANIYIWTALTGELLQLLALLCILISIITHRKR